MNKLLLLLLFVVGTAGADNLISIDQVSSGNNNSTTVTVEGSGNTVDYSFGGANNTVNVYQEGEDNTFKYTDTWGSGASWGGDLDGSNNNITSKQYTDSAKSLQPNYTGFHIYGDYNTVKLGQGWFINDSGTYNSTPAHGYGDHYIRLDIHGDSNNVIATQRTDGANEGQSMILDVYSDSNTIYAQQRQGAHSLDLTTNNDGNDVWIKQEGQPSHSATITLNGTYATDLTLTQGCHACTTSQTYSLTQSCATVGGCSVSVSQGQ